MDSILITSANGNIGSQIVKNLLEKYVRFSVGISSVEKSITGLNNKVLDFTNMASLKKAFAGVDTLFLLYPMNAQMVVNNENAIEAALECGVKHIIRSSGAGADSDSPYLMPKTQGIIDEHIKASGIRYTLTRPVAFMQNFVNFMAYDIKNGTVYQPLRGDSELSWVDVRDIAAVNTKIILSPENYENIEMTISGAKPLSYIEALNVIGKTIGKDINFVTVPDEAAIDAMKQYQMSDFNIDMMMSLNQSIDDGKAIYQTDTVHKVTGKSPISFTDFAKDYADVW